jgi:hypothetical protein
MRVVDRDFALHAFDSLRHRSGFGWHRRIVRVSHSFRHPRGLRTSVADAETALGSAAAFGSRTHAEPRQRRLGTTRHPRISLQNGQPLAQFPYPSAGSCATALTRAKSSMTSPSQSAKPVTEKSLREIPSHVPAGPSSETLIYARVAGRHDLAVALDRQSSHI